MNSGRYIALANKQNNPPERVIHQCSSTNKFGKHQNILSFAKNIDK
jgi:hypothetical protein